MSDEAPSTSPPSPISTVMYSPPALVGTEPLSTERLDLRRFKKRDAAALKTWSDDSSSLRFLCARKIEDLASAQDVIASWQAQYGDPSFLCWCIQLSETREAIGKIGASIDVSLASADIEYVITSSARGKGYAKEALSKVLSYLHERGIYRVQAKINVENAASIAVAESAGMALEGIMACALKNRRGAFYDVALFSHVSRV